jgi:hypothetical protein
MHRCPGHETDVHRHTITPVIILIPDVHVDTSYGRNYVFVM